MSEKKENIAARIEEIAAPEAEKLGLSIWDVFYGKEGQDKILRITIDKEGGIFIADCEALSRAVDPLIDDSGLISEAYRFEVSSPGLGRKIRTDSQFGKYVGQPVLVRLIRADENGNRDYAGILTSFDSDTFTVSAEAGSATIQRNSVSYVKADDDTDF